MLEIFMKNKNSIVTLNEFEKLLNVSKTVIRNEIDELQTSNCGINCINFDEYMFIEDTIELSSSAISGNLKTKILGSTIEIFETIGSTNTYLKNKNLRDVTEGHVVLAETQTNGIGRMNRTFYSPHKQGIYLSILLKPVIKINKIHFLTILTSVAVCNAIETVCQFKPQIKWVNDIYYKNKKLGGILTEVSLSAEIQSLDSVVIGIGINTGHVSNEVADIATSLYEITGKNSYRNQLISEILNQLENLYFDFIINNNKNNILSAYREKQFIFNKRVTIISSNKRFEATVLGIDNNGNLIVKDTFNKLLYLNSGEVSLELNNL
jgi:BirA family transcriptional regulator, biotin operon repressor / biotin---[acetyl-CoA-carboxylase] ligase